VATLLLLAFAYFHIRSAAAREVVERLAREKGALLGESRIEAGTDALTGLGNRRALAGDTNTLRRAVRAIDDLYAASKTPGSSRSRGITIWQTQRSRAAM
jgi:hypothetical protein